MDVLVVSVMGEPSLADFEFLDPFDNYPEQWLRVKHKETNQPFLAYIVNNSGKTTFSPQVAQPKPAKLLRIQEFSPIQFTWK